MHTAAAASTPLFSNNLLTNPFQTRPTSDFYCLPDSPYWRSRNTFRWADPSLWPAASTGIQIERYDTMKSLCDANSPVSQNMGCACIKDKPGANTAYLPVVCRPGNQFLHASPLKEACLRLCTCADSERSAIQGWIDFSTGREYLDLAVSRIYRVTDSLEPYRKWAVERASPYLEKIPNVPGLRKPKFKESCSRECVVNNDCGRHCACHISMSRSSYDSMPMLLQQTRHCGPLGPVLIDSSSFLRFGNKKRDEGFEIDACVCNSTYISKGCCDVTDGLLWEDPELKLG